MLWGRGRREEVESASCDGKERIQAGQGVLDFPRCAQRQGLELERIGLQGGVGLEVGPDRLTRP